MVKEFLNLGNQALPAIRFIDGKEIAKGFFPLEIELQPSKILMEFQATKIVIGRSSTADFKIPSPCVSRRHCFLSWSLQGWTLRDLDSKNGTYVNGNAVVVKRIEEEDEIKIGNFTFIVKRAEAEFQLFRAIQEYKRAA